MWRELIDVPNRAWFATLALGAFGLVAFGMGLQTLLRLNPCPLCIFQRLLYLLVGLAAFAGLLLPAARLLWGGLIGLIGAAGVAVGGYQSWMQAFPEFATACGYAEPNAIERLVDWLGMQWPALFLATGFCTDLAWQFAGLSMANWSALIFAAIAAAGGWLALRAKP